MADDDKPEWVDGMPSIGQRIHASLVSYMAGRMGVDSTLKMMKGSIPKPEWDELGMLLLRDMVNSLEPPIDLERAKKILAFKKPKE